MVYKFKLTIDINNQDCLPYLQDAILKAAANVIGKGGSIISHSYAAFPQLDSGATYVKINFKDKKDE